MADGRWISNGQMDATLRYKVGANDWAQPKVTLQPHMIKIEAGKAYSAIVETKYPVDILNAVRIHWRSYPLETPSNIPYISYILAENVKIEPLYLLGDEQVGNTKVFCYPSKPVVKIDSDASGPFNSICK